MDKPDLPLEVVRVQLPDVSWQTHRDLNGLHPSRYPVIVQLSRTPDPFEEVALRRISAMVQPVPGAEAEGVITNTTLRFVGKALSQINKELAAAVDLAVRLRDEASAADEEMAQLVRSINKQLRAERSLPAIEAAPAMIGGR